MIRHVLRMSDLDAFEVSAVLDLAEAPHLEPVLAGKGAALLFEHPSARTRNASEMAVFQLGGHPVTIRGEEVGLDRRESVEDVARTLACYHGVIGARVARHSTLERMAAALEQSGVAVPVINLLSDLEHPTQALADLLTIRQCFGGLAGRKVAYIGDGNNVARSLLEACALSGVRFVAASPEGHRLSEEDLTRARELGGTVELVERPEEAVEGADVLYTDVWVSMGEESETAERRARFAGYRIDEALLDRAGPDAVLLHCLPAHRGEEVSEAALEGSRSRVWLQAENRMHAIRGLLGLMFGASTKAPS